MMKKSFAELELSFLHLQQNVKILEKHLITSVIQPAVEQVNTHYGKPLLLMIRCLQAQAPGTGTWHSPNVSRIPKLIILP